MVSSHSEAVRPSLNVTTQEEIKGDGLSHHGDTDMDEADQHSEKKSASSRDKVEADSRSGEEERHEEKDEDKDEEAQEPVTRRAPKGPTKEEREKHEATHLPFREWCDRVEHEPNHTRGSKKKEMQRKRQR